MLDGLTPDLAPRLVLAIGGVGIALVILVLVLIFLKRRNSPLFIKGGKAREPRLMVLDAAAVDPKRRLVLIRRDGEAWQVGVLTANSDVAELARLAREFRPDLAVIADETVSTFLAGLLGAVSVMGAAFVLMRPVSGRNRG